MTGSEALKIIRAAARFGRLVYTRHAYERMAERNAAAEDVERAIQTATTCMKQPAGTWKVSGGRDRDGDALDVVCAVAEGVVVVTLF